ncbi:aminoglycoside phosphotransferase family protein [Limnobacter parvus]|uniref:Phosphotransferase n=1 Tax=Limnobacter parvus TaxID=2939690 RepID=A0ABT1XG67_9BURK|nr:phosphotransferase [Limnobacter parvus]MCR2746262.1 phosphotransferase [Limnobacter parvus]
MSALRQEMLKKWLAGLSKFEFDLDTLQAASSDASFRRYFRVSESNAARTLIVMDAPPEKEDVRPFVRVAELLRQGGANAPGVLAQNADEGFLLLQDFGNTTMLQGLHAQPTQTDAFYIRAIQDLVNMQANTPTKGLPAYGADKLLQEMNLFDEWYVGRHYGAELTDQERNWLDSIKGMLIQSALAEPQVFVHRDYHSRNLMLTSAAGDAPQFGVLDFQDAVKGPLSYDLVSILRDAYIEWPEAQTLDWTVRYWEASRKAGLPICEDPGEFYRQFDFMGLQRHLKILGIFARLNHRDGKAQYLNDLPMVLRYVRLVAGRYIAFKPLLLLLDRLENKAVKVGFTF